MPKVSSGGLLVCCSTQNCGSNLFKRDSTNFKKEDFILDLLDIDWNTTLQTNKNDPDFSFNQFYEKINCIIDNHLPPKKASKKELKLEDQYLVYLTR